MKEDLDSVLKRNTEVNMETIQKANFTKLLNLSNVASVWYNGDKKVVFNLANSIKISGVITTDYVSKVFDTTEEAQAFFESLSNLGFMTSNGFNANGTRHEHVNMKYVSTWTINEDKVIFNFTYSTQVKIKGDDRIISRFVVWEGEEAVKRAKETVNNHYEVKPTIALIEAKWHDIINSNESRTFYFEREEEEVVNTMNTVQSIQEVNKREKVGKIKSTLPFYMEPICNSDEKIIDGVKVKIEEVDEF